MKIALRIAHGTAELDISEVEGRRERTKENDREREGGRGGEYLTRGGGGGVDIMQALRHGQEGSGLLEDGGRWELEGCGLSLCENLHVYTRKRRREEKGEESKGERGREGRREREGVDEGYN